jgi:hypothetical protein
MLRVGLSLIMGIALLGGGIAQAASATNNKSDKDAKEATIAKLDTGKNTIEVLMKGDNGTEVEKTLTMADKPEYLDHKGKATKLDTFRAGDSVLITEKDGKVTVVEMEHKAARIMNFDANNGKITLMMKDLNGKDIEKTFRLVEDTEFVDSTGMAATRDVFRSGDDVLIVEQQGEIKELKKDSKHDDTTSHATKQSEKTASDKK